LPVATPGGPATSQAARARRAHGAVAGRVDSRSNLGVATLASRDARE